MHAASQPVNTTNCKTLSFPLNVHILESATLSRRACQIKKFGPRILFQSKCNQCDRLWIVWPNDQDWNVTSALKLEQVLKEEDIILPGDLSAVISLLFPEHSVSRLKASACVTKVAGSPSPHTSPSSEKCTIHQTCNAACCINEPSWPMTNRQCVHFSGCAFQSYHFPSPMRLSIIIWRVLPWLEVRINAWDFGVKGFFENEYGKSN